MKRFLQNAYVALVACLSVAAFVCLAFLSFDVGKTSAVAYFIGVAASFALAPILHETGHVLFAKANGFRVVFVKCFVFCYDATGDKRRFSLCSPFSDEQTQALPLRSKNMRRRALLYTLGGQITGALYVLVLTLVSILCYSASAPCTAVAFFSLGSLPYAAYLFLLNLPPFVYGRGRTDMRVAADILLKKPLGVRFIASLETQGKLSEGYSYCELPQRLFDDLPPVPEDEPLFILDCFCRYYAAAERGEIETAARCINRLASLAPYLSPKEENDVLSELLYFNALLCDEEQSKKCFDALFPLGVDACVSPTAANYRAAAAYYAMRGDKTKSEKYVLLSQNAAEKHPVEGVRLSEHRLLGKIDGLTSGEEG